MAAKKAASSLTSNSGPQLALFTPAQANLKELDFTPERALAERLPLHVLLGTSSWTFTGWKGIVYPDYLTERDLVDRGLEFYARYPLFRTVGIDRSYYNPLSENDFLRYSEQLSPGFRCVMKAWSRITTFTDARTGERIQTFLDPHVFEDKVLGPALSAFQEHLGPVVLEFPPMRREDLPSPQVFADKLAHFLDRIPKHVSYAVELRNRELLAPPYLEMLQAFGVSHVLNLWERMPDIASQLAHPGVLTAPFVVCRLMLRPGDRYEDKEKAYAPFNKIVEEDLKMRADVAELVKVCGRLQKQVFLIINNKVEGSSPLTARALAERIVAETARP